MKQFNMFSKAEEEEKKYSVKIEAPIYEPKYEKPHIMELCNRSKSQRMISEIDNSNVSEEEKAFLKDAAARHNVFHYEKIADYYAQASVEMQYLMERSALVIIDFEKAIELGYVKLCSDIKNQYLQEYGE
jgi:hypothetical protein